MVYDTICVCVIPTKRPKKESRHNKLADGNVTVTFVIPLRLKREIGRIAAGEGVVPSEFMRLNLANSVRRHNAAKKKLVQPSATGGIETAAGG